MGGSSPGGATTHLHASSVSRIEFEGPDAADVKVVLREWFGSPYWPEAHFMDDWFRDGDAFGASRVVAELDDNALSVAFRQPSDDGRPPGAALALVDRYTGSEPGVITPARLAAMDRAFKPGSRTVALLQLDDDRVVASSIPALMALVIGEAISTCVRYPVDHGITRVLGMEGRFPGGDGLAARRRRRPALLPTGSAVLGVTCLVPTSAGVAARAHVAASPSAAVPVALYPLVATLIPEASGHLVPLIRTDDLVSLRLVRAPVQPVSRIGAHLWLMTNGIAESCARVARNYYVRVLRLLKVIAETRVMSRLMAAFGIDTRASSGIVSRLLRQPSPNPWLTTTTAMVLATRLVPTQDAPGNDRLTAHGVDERAC